MNFISVVIAAALSILIIGTIDSPVVVSANTIQVMFNNGTAMTSSTFCSAADEVEIGKIMKNISLHSLVSPGSLRGRSMTDMAHNIATLSSSSSLSIDADRQLYPAHCADTCSGYVPRTCRKAQCLNYRRRNLEEEKEDASGHNFVRNNDNRHLLVSSCTMLKAHSHRLFDNLISSTGLISNTCKVFIARNSRKIDCIYDAVYGEVTGMRASSNTTVLSHNVTATGWSVCRSVGMIRLEALVNECVVTVHIRVTTPDSNVVHTFQDVDAPYEIGLLLPLSGVYSATFTPNRLGSSKAKTFTFSVNNC